MNNGSPDSPDEPEPGKDDPPEPVPDDDDWSPTDPRTRVPRAVEESKFAYELQNRREKLAYELQDRRDKSERLQSAVLQQERELQQRSNVFLVTESLLLIAYSIILSQGLAVGTVVRTHQASLIIHSQQLSLIISVITAFGLLFSLTWAYTNYYLMQNLMYMRRRSHEHFADSERFRPEYGKFIGSGFFASRLIAFAIPAIASVLWLLLLLFNLLGLV